MPEISTLDTFVVFVDEELNSLRSFGCYDKEKLTIIYLPNIGYSTQSNTSTAHAMMENGIKIATKDGEEGWAECLGCSTLEKRKLELPGACGGCLDDYCYRRRMGCTSPRETGRRAGSCPRKSQWKNSLDVVTESHYYGNTFIFGISLLRLLYHP